MTVCIAAICESGRALVVAADRMFTAGMPVNIEFETAEKKIQPLASACVALFSGDSAAGNEITQRAIASLGGATVPTIAAAASAMKNAYAATREEKVRERVMLPLLGPDFTRVEAMGTTVTQYMAPQGAIYQQLAIAMNQFGLGVDFLVAGVDGHGAAVRLITHPGTTYDLDKLGFHAIGSGAQHAHSKLCLSGQNRGVPLQETLYRVYEAKRAAEVAQGVGVKTDMAIVMASGITDCDTKTLEELGRIFDATQKQLPPLDSLATMVPKVK